MLKPLVNLLVLSFLTLLPLVPPFWAGYEQSKVIFFIFSLFIIGLLWSIGIHLKVFKIHYSKLTIFAVLFLLSLTLTAFLGIDSIKSLTGRPPYLQGLIVYYLLFCLSFIISGLNIPLKYFAAALSLSALLVSLTALKDWVAIHLFNQLLPTYAGRVVSTFGSPNLYAGFLLMVLPFNYWLLLKLQRWTFLKKLFLISLFSSMAAIAVSLSRSTILILVVLIFLVLLSKLKLWLRIVILLIFISALILTGKFLVEKNAGLFYSEFIQPKDKYFLFRNSPERRGLIYPHIYELVLQKPFFGYGIDSLEVIFPQKFNILHQTDPSFPALKSLLLDRSHNYVLDLLIFSGLAGFISWYLLIWVMIKRSFKNKVLLFFLLIYLVWIQFQIQSIVHLTLFWTAAGILNKTLVLDKQREHSV